MINLTAALQSPVNDSPRALQTACQHGWLQQTRQWLEWALVGRELNKRNQSTPHAVEGTAKVRIHVNYCSHTSLQTNWPREVTHDYAPVEWMRKLVCAFPF